jgi:hypothetical protein
LLNSATSPLFPAKLRSSLWVTCEAYIDPAVTKRNPLLDVVRSTSIGQADCIDFSLGDTRLA